jgi:hypothetical protein
MPDRVIKSTALGPETMSNSVKACLCPNHVEPLHRQIVSNNAAVSYMQTLYNRAESVLTGYGLLGFAYSWGT